MTLKISKRGQGGRKTETVPDSADDHDDVIFERWSTVICDICKSHFHSMDKFKEHARQEHADAFDPRNRFRATTYSCPKCKSHQNSISDLRQHQSCRTCIARRSRALPVRLLQGSLRGRRSTGASCVCSERLTTDSENNYVSRSCCCYSTHDIFCSLFGHFKRSIYNILIHF